MVVLYRRQKYKQSLEQAKLLKNKEPSNLKFQIAYANQCVAVVDFHYDDIFDMRSVVL